METHVKQGRQIRENKVRVIEERLRNSNAIIINDFRGLTVTQISELRAALSSCDSRIYVQKNNLTKIALKHENYPETLEEYLKGPSAIAYIQGDYLPALKALFNFAKRPDISLHVKGAYADNIVLNAAQAEQFSNLPSKEQLIVQLMWVMRAPVQNLVTVLQDIVARFARVLQAVADSKKE